MRQKYYLNDYGTALPRIRIESTRGGIRQLWVAKTTRHAMEVTKQYLDRVWGK